MRWPHHFPAIPNLLAPSAPSRRLWRAPRALCAVSSLFPTSSRPLRRLVIFGDLHATSAPSRRLWRPPRDLSAVSSSLATSSHPPCTLHALFASFATSSRPLSRLVAIPDLHALAAPFSRHSQPPRALCAVSSSFASSSCPLRRFLAIPDLLASSAPSRRLSRPPRVLLAPSTPSSRLSRPLSARLAVSSSFATSTRPSARQNPECFRCDRTGYPCVRCDICRKQAFCVKCLGSETLGNPLEYFEKAVKDQTPVYFGCLACLDPEERYYEPFFTYNESGEMVRVKGVVVYATGYLYWPDDNPHPGLSLPVPTNWMEEYENDKKLKALGFNVEPSLPPGVVDLNDKKEGSSKQQADLSGEEEDFSEEEEDSGEEK
ncbi:hypothetical protein SCHPADRAFT_944425 [Schizopora paradoxa]|uniref:Uncharacterized protein n=1 Tax=Schizopora paradoxa TaxID=27342 RepID=A0A0H2R9F6_9AGAM|nr:hypothetical protein SCHPADRAFT_944425 [Schizopora paradoxa]